MLVAKKEVRYTPAGLAVLEASCRHAGALNEAGRERKLSFEFSAVALGAVAQGLAREPLGAELMLAGFIAPRTQKGLRLAVHVAEFRAAGQE